MAAEENRKNAKAQVIVRAALNLFSRKGYPLTSIEQISEEAGIGKSTVYEYFDNKEALFEAAITAAADQWIAGLEAIGPQTGDAVARLRRIAEMFIERQDPINNPGRGLFIEVLCQSTRQGCVFTDRPHLIGLIYRRVVKVVVGYLLEGISSGQLRPEIARNAEAIAINFLAVLDGIQLHSMVAPDVVVSRDQVAFFLDQALPALVAESAAAQRHGV